MPHRFFNFLSLFWNIFLEAIFPWQCCFCKRETSDYPLCQTCKNNIPINSSFINPNRKKRIHNFSKDCCSKNKLFYALGFTSSYKNPILAKTLHLFKYQRIISLKEPLSNLMIKFLKKTKFFSITRKENFLIIPIPLHYKKQKKRGFNQSELLAENISSYFSLSYNSEILIRIKNNSPQANIPNLTEREKNVKNIFGISLSKTTLIKNKWIILVDDVYTSGSTMQEAAKVLQKYKPKKIIGLVLAKG
jgi:competence protein ComFC